jgi:serine-type D-Ala-D-Ala carboxypeptidase (penicillin-binding protein 5/6)
MQSLKTQEGILGIAALLSAVFIMVLIFASPTMDTVSTEITTPHIYPEDRFSDVTVHAKAAFVFNAATGEILYEKNKNVQLPLASITKVMTSIVASEKLAGDTNITISEQDLQTEGDSGLLANEKWKLRDLLNFSMMVSSNDGARALASAVSAFNRNTFYGDNIHARSFVEEMNLKAQVLGLKQTYFLNPTGLDESDTQSGGYGSAQDVAHMFAYALERAPEAMEATIKDNMWFTSTSGFEHPAINTNEALGNIPGLIAGKTGYTTLAGGNLVVAFDAGFGDPIVAVVLGSTREGRFDDMTKLVYAALR